MKKIYLDTNVLISLKVRREPFFSKAEKLLRDCFNGKIILYIPLPALLETEWVLKSFYKQPRQKIYKFLEELLIIEHIKTESKTDFQIALKLYKDTASISLVDALIIKQALNLEDFEFLTFDKNMDKIYKSLNQ